MTRIRSVWTDAIGKVYNSRVFGNLTGVAWDGGLKVAAKNGWFAARPAGTENIYKIYAESFQGPEHLRRIQDEARAIVSDALAASPQQRGNRTSAFRLI